MEIVLKIEYHASKRCVVDMLVSLLKEVADELATDLNEGKLKYAELYALREGGSVYSGCVGELSRIQRALLRSGVAYNTRGFILLDENYDARIDVHDYVV